MTTSSSEKWPIKRLLLSPVAGLVLGFSQALGQTEESKGVELQLTIPEAPFHVVGDPAPLNWKFINPSDQRLAFMWEGCCRLNGRVSATLGQVTFQSEPSNDPAQLTAHRFARAARLYPGKSTQFETAISDWLQISESGAYQFSASYTGLLDNQRPNVTPGWQLWRQSTQSKPVETTLLIPIDYVARRVTLGKASGLSLSIKKDNPWNPIHGIQLELTFKNQSGQQLFLSWPSEFGIWILDSDNRRVPLSPTQIKTPPEELKIDPNDQIKKKITLDGRALESKPFGTYRVFVDYKTDDRRTPSNLVDINWQLSQSQLANLIRAASGGAKTGLRNKPLKLLRLHIASLGQALFQVDVTRFDTKGQRLLSDLKLAAKLKSFGPKPGLVTVKLSIEKDGSLKFANQALAESLPPKGSIVENLNSITSIQRHLGWTVAVELQPKERVTEMQIAQALESLKSIERNLSKPPVLKTN